MGIPTTATTTASFPNTMYMNFNPSCGLSNGLVNGGFFHPSLMAMTSFAPSSTSAAQTLGAYPAHQGLRFQPWAMYSSNDVMMGSSLLYSTNLKNNIASSSSASESAKNSSSITHLAIQEKSVVRPFYASSPSTDSSSTRSQSPTDSPLVFSKKAARKSKKRPLLSSPAPHILNPTKSGQTSDFRGVIWDSTAKSWRTKIKLKNKTWYLGIYKDEVVAARGTSSFFLNTYFEAKGTNPTSLLYVYI